MKFKTVFTRVAITEITRGTRTSPISRKEDEIMMEIRQGKPMNPIIRMYFMPSKRIASACEFPMTIRLRILRGKAKHETE